SRIEYGLTNGVYDRYRTGDNGDPLGTGHVATAISLEPGKVYYFRVVSLLNTPRVDASASDDAPTPLINNTAPTSAAVTPLTVSDLTASQEKVGGPTSITFSTDRPASVIITIGPTSKLDSMVSTVYGPLADYAYPPFTRNLHNISVQLPAGTWYYRVEVYDEQGIGLSDIKSATIT
ncbi:MAG TPA: hypothetical protein VIC60_00435, partial [Thermomicrobiales bacterium]